MRPIEEPMLCRVIRRAVDMVYPKMALVGWENIPQEPCILVGNHSQAHGAIVTEERLPLDHYTWCASQMMDKELVADYCYRDFWFGKPRCVRWLYWLVSRVISGPAVYIMTNARTIPVYRDSRCISTFRRSIEKLRDGYSLVIYPECREPYNNIVFRFQDRFIDLAKLFYGKTGQSLCFVPMYIAPELKKIFFGEPVRFDPGSSAVRERERICTELMERITAIAVAQPLHTVVPYPNVPKKQYPKNLPLEVYRSEEAG